MNFLSFVPVSAYLVENLQGPLQVCMYPGLWTGLHLEEQSMFFVVHSHLLCPGLIKELATLNISQPRVSRTVCAVAHLALHCWAPPAQT